jgi:hypothetical protein
LQAAFFMCKKSKKGEYIMQQYKKTIAIQVTDQEFLDQYEARIKESGLKVKDYLTGLIQADIAQAQQARQEETPVQDAAAAIQPEAPQPEQTAEPVPTAEDPVQTSDNTPAQNAAMTNLFVKITSEQRAELDTRKQETGETVNEYVNRVINGFLKDVRSGDISEELNETYDYYNSPAETCDTTCSAKVPTDTINELTAYLESSGRSSNHQLFKARYIGENHFNISCVQTADFLKPSFDLFCQGYFKYLIAAAYYKESYIQNKVNKILRGTLLCK